MIIQLTEDSRIFKKITIFLLPQDLIYLKFTNKSLKEKIENNLEIENQILIFLSKNKEIQLKV